MKTYVNKDALLHKMQERHEDLKKNYCKYDNYVMGFGEAIKIIEKTPAVTYVHEDEEGEWIRMNDKEVKCSCCSLIRNIATRGLEILSVVRSIDVGG